MTIKGKLCCQSSKNGKQQSNQYSANGDQEKRYKQKLFPNREIKRINALLPDATAKSRVFKCFVPIVAISDRV